MEAFEQSRLSSASIEVSGTEDTECGKFFLCAIERRNLLHGFMHSVRANDRNVNCDRAH
jgi:hypothetical protein